MAMSMGMAKGYGHSHGPLGHGGHMNDKHMEPHGSAHHMAKVHVQDPGGHTMSNEHGGGFAMGC